MRITLDQFCEQWAPKNNGRYLPHKMEFNTHDFVTAAGRLSLSRFRSGFVEGGFYGSGRKWPPRRSKWGLKYTHPVMRDSGTLARTIEGEADRMDRTNITQKASPGRRAIFRRGAGYTIRTTAATTMRSSKRGPSKSYAAVHNTDPKFGLYYVNQHAARHSKRRPEHRQFIGLSQRLDRLVNRLYIPLLFRGFPATENE